MKRYTLGHTEDLPSLGFGLFVGSLIVWVSGLRLLRVHLGRIVGAYSSRLRETLPGLLLDWSTLT